MSDCLGIYIEDNLIKYAKVSKVKKNLQISAYGVSFYSDTKDDLSSQIKRIISETDSSKTPISINVSGEMYNYFKMFSLLSSKDLEKATETEFEYFCEDKGYNKNTFESRYALVPDKHDSDKLKAIYISSNITEIDKKIAIVNSSNLKHIYPLPMCVPNLIDNNEIDNCLIVNIEANTTITVIKNHNLDEIEVLEKGAEEILTDINAEENSYSKSYEILKNSTIYTVDTGDMDIDENSYLDKIMPTLYDIVEKIRVKLENEDDIVDVYLTGTGALINNIDLYFKEYLGEYNCNLLKPYFLQTEGNVNVKDYIEVNSAIALAIQGLGMGITGINLMKKGTTQAASTDLLKMNAGDAIKQILENIKNNSGENDNIQKWLTRICCTVASVVVVYSVGSIYISNQMNKKIEQANKVKRMMQTEMNELESDIEMAKSRTSKYDSMIEDLDSANNLATTNELSKNAIITLLNQIQNVIPQEVQLTLIQNTDSKHIVINAQAERYEQLGYFVSKIKNDGILSPSTVVATPGVKADDNLIKITIEGDLP